MAAKTRIEGAAELDKVLQRLPTIVSRSVGRGALQAGARPIREAAKQKAPRDEGDLSRNIVARTVRRGRDEILVRIGPTKEAFQGLFQEFGTKNHPAQPFMRPAFDENAQEALTRIGRQFGRGVERAAKRLAGPIGKSGLLRRRRRR